MPLGNKETQQLHLERYQHPMTMPLKKKDSVFSKSEKQASTAFPPWPSGALSKKIQGQEAEASYLMAVMYADENISSTAFSKWATVTWPGEPGFWQEDSQISVARLQMSRQRRASPERAATYKRDHFIP